MCFSLVSMLDFMDQNLTPLKSRLSKLQSWHQNFSCLVGPNEHFYTRCLLSARTSHGTLFYDICSQTDSKGPLESILAVLFLIRKI